MPLQPREVSLPEAIAQAAACADALRTLAEAHREAHHKVDQTQTIRHWQADAGTYCYQTHIAISGQPGERLAWLAEILYNAACMQSQPWYPQFLGGESQPVEAEPPANISEHQLVLGKFDLGLKKARCYRQLVSLARPEADTAIIAARSVDAGPPLPGGVALAYTLAPNGEVLYWSDNCLHWHHICCTPGAALLPGFADRWLINAMRWLRFDGVERGTYHAEALNMQRWLQGGAGRQG